MARRKTRPPREYLDLAEAMDRYLVYTVARPLLDFPTHLVLTPEQYALVHGTTGQITYRGLPLVVG